MKLKDWIEKVDLGWDWRSTFDRELPPDATYSENNRFCQVFTPYGPPMRRMLTDLEDYTLVNVQYWDNSLMESSDYDLVTRPALFSFQRKQKQDRNKATPWKLRSR